MARIYNQEQYEGSFSPRQQSRGFQAVQAVDNTSKERQRMQQELRDIDTQTKSLTRQQGLDSGILKAQQGIERANMQARNAAINGLLSLSKTAVSAMGSIAKQQEIAQQEQALNDEATALLIGTNEAAPRLDNAVAVEGQQDAQAYAIGDAASSIEDKAVAESVVKDSANALASRSITKISTHEAAARIGLDLSLIHI